MPHSVQLNIWLHCIYDILIYSNLLIFNSNTTMQNLMEQFLIV